MFVDWLHADGVQNLELRLALHGRFGEVGYLGGKFKTVALPEETRWVGRDHQVFLRHHSAGGIAVVHGFGVGKDFKIPAGERFVHFKFDQNIACFIGFQGRQEKDGLFEIGPHFYIPKICLFFSDIGGGLFPV